MGEHWDTHLMGQWMAWNAHNILEGRFLVPDFNANFFYPHSYTLAFSEPLWPQSYLYAAVFGLSKNPFLSFNVTLLAFWVLSGMLMIALLRELGFARGISLLGGLIYCLMPYRLGYYIEFNMSLVFIIPLLLLVTIRWLERPKISTSLWWIFAFWISATSCLYYTIMMLTPVTTIAVVALLRDPTLLKRAQTWIFAGLVAVAVVGVAWVYLEPYLVLRIEGGFVRTLDDYQKHFAQATQYLNPRASQQQYTALGLAVPSFNVRWTEAVAFPGTLLLLLLFVHFFTRVTTVVDRGGVAVTSFNIARGVLWIAFWGIIILSWAPWGAAHAPVSSVIVWWVAFAVFSMSLLHLVVSPPQESRPDALVRGLGVAAVICFFLSLGPEITVGSDHDLITLANNPARHLFEQVPIYGAVRGLSRFTIIVLTFLVIAACLTLSRAVSHQPRLWIIICVMPVLLIFEARQVFYEFVDDGRTYHRPVSLELRKLPDDTSLLQLPLGLRDVDSTVTMLTIGNFNKLINGHSGFVPYRYRYWMQLQDQWDIDALAREMKTIWPQPWLLIDGAQWKMLMKRKGLPDPEDRILANWTLQKKDSLYRLYRPRSDVPPDTAPLNRVVRTDVLKRNPVLTVRARSTGKPVDLQISVNGKIIAQSQERAVRVTGKWTDVSVVLPLEHAGEVDGDVVKIDTRGADGVLFEEVRFGPSQ